MLFRSKPRNPAQRLRTAVESMPVYAREAMLRGIDSNTIIAGAYADPGIGGICPMLAAHRNGGRTNLASFARSWDRYTGADRARVATGRELRTLRNYLELSLAAELNEHEPLADAVTRIRAERAEFAAAEAAAVVTDEPAHRPQPTRLTDTGERDRTRELHRRERWAWILPSRSYSLYKRRIAAAEEAMSESRAARLLDVPPPRERTRV